MVSPSAFNFFQLNKQFVTGYFSTSGANGLDIEFIEPQLLPTPTWMNLSTCVSISSAFLYETDYKIALRSSMVRKGFQLVTNGKFFKIIRTDFKNKKEEYAKRFIQIIIMSRNLHAKLKYLENKAEERKQCY